MKRRYSPAARRAHAAHLRAKYRQPIVREVATIDPLPGDPKYPMFDFIRACHRQVSYVAQGLVTMREMADNIQWMVERWEVDTAPATSCELPHRVQPEPAPNPYCSDYAGVVFDAELIEKHKSCGPECPVKRSMQPEPAPKPFLCVRCKQPCSPDYSLCQDCFDKDNGTPTPRPEPKPEIEQRRDAELERVWREGLLTTPRYQEELRKIERDPRLGICQACHQLCVPGFLYHSECFNGYTPDPLLQPPAPKPPKVGGYYSEYENGTWIQQAESAEDWAAGLTMPSPPWEGGAA